MYRYAQIAPFIFRHVLAKAENLDMRKCRGYWPSIRPPTDAAVRQHVASVHQQVVEACAALVAQVSYLRVFLYSLTIS